MKRAEKGADLLKKCVSSALSFGETVMDLLLADWHSLEICGIAICGLAHLRHFCGFAIYEHKICFPCPPLIPYKTSERFYFKFKSNLRRKMYMLHSVQRNVVLVIEKSRLCTHTKLLEY